MLITSEPFKHALEEIYPHACAHTLLEADPTTVTPGLLLLGGKLLGSTARGKKNGIINSAGKWMEPEMIVLSEVTQIQKTNVTCSLASEALAPN